MTQTSEDSHINLAREAGNKYAETGQPVIVADKPVLAPSPEGENQITIAHVTRAFQVGGEAKK